VGNKVLKTATFGLGALGWPSVLLCYPKLVVTIYLESKQVNNLITIYSRAPLFSCK